MKNFKENFADDRLVLKGDALIQDRGKMQKLAEHAFSKGIPVVVVPCSAPIDGDELKGFPIISN